MQGGLLLGIDCWGVASRDPLPHSSLPRDTYVADEEVIEIDKSSIHANGVGPPRGAPRVGAPPGVGPPLGVGGPWAMAPPTHYVLFCYAIMMSVAHSVSRSNDVSIGYYVCT